MKKTLLIAALIFAPLLLKAQDTAITTFFQDIEMYRRVTDSVITHPTDVITAAEVGERLNTLVSMLEQVANSIEPSPPIVIHRHYEIAGALYYILAIVGIVVGVNSAYWLVVGVQRRKLLEHLKETAIKLNRKLHEAETLPSRECEPAAFEVKRYEKG